MQKIDITLLNTGISAYRALALIALRSFLDLVTAVYFIASAHPQISEPFMHTDVGRSKCLTLSMNNAATNLGRT